MLKTILIITLISAIPIAALYFFQARLIYHPHHYTSDYEAKLAAVTKIKYQTPQGLQTAFFLPPNQPTSSEPLTLWILFHGNAGLALDWFNLVNEAREKSIHHPTAFFLIDYPGFGLNSGTPSPETLLNNSISALAALRAHLNANNLHLAPSNPNILGWSLGAAAALQLATISPPERLILISPFTSTLDVARSEYGTLLADTLLTHIFDNVNQLKKLLSINPTAAITIFHGEEDTRLPITMSQTLAQISKDQIHLIPIPQTGHNDIVSIIWDRLVKELTL